MENYFYFGLMVGAWLCFNLLYFIFRLFTKYAARICFILVLLSMFACIGLIAVVFYFGMNDFLLYLIAGIAILSGGLLSVAEWLFYSMVKA